MIVNCKNTLLISYQANILPNGKSIPFNFINLCIMNIQIITIGDELLIGQVVDTNSAWMAERLNESGFRVERIVSIGDSPEAIIEALDDAASRVKIILITGGLGPTRDDLTRDTLCKYFNTNLILNSEVEAGLESFFASRGKPLTDTNRNQAYVPEKCVPIMNLLGTAPGMWFEENGKIFVSMPGVPFEMKGMMEQFVLPKLTEKYQLPPVFHFTVTTVGIGESFLADKLSEFESSLPGYVRMAYLPGPGMVRLRLSCYDSSKEKEDAIRKLGKTMEELAGKYFFGEGDLTPQEMVGNWLTKTNSTLSIAESCTGGYLSHLITSVPGSSVYYIGSSISYANEVKTQFLGVNPEVIASKGAVSEEVAIAMAKGVRDRLKSTWALATTGVAGPGGGTPEKPVGTVWIGVAGPGGVTARKYHFGKDRVRNIQMSALFAFNMLRNEMFVSEKS
jgi:nicotinamide-nucleotide amidase